jgi:hypothetical protein
LVASPCHRLPPSPRGKDDDVRDESLSIRRQQMQDCRGTREKITRRGPVKIGNFASSESVLRLVFASFRLLEVANDGEDGQVRKERALLSGRPDRGHGKFLNIPASTALPGRQSRNAAPSGLSDLDCRDRASSCLVPHFSRTTGALPSQCEPSFRRLAQTNASTAAGRRYRVERRSQGKQSSSEELARHSKRGAWTEE